MAFDLRETLEAARDARRDEVAHYDLNIENFRRAIKIAAKDPDLKDFVKQLRKLLRDNQHERKKAAVMLQVVKDRLAEMESDSD